MFDLDDTRKHVISAENGGFLKLLVLQLTNVNSM